MDVFAIPVVALYTFMVAAFSATMAFVIIGDIRHERRMKK